MGLEEMRVLDESDFIFDVLLQIAIKCDTRVSSNCQSVEYQLALEVLAIQVSETTTSKAMIKINRF
jgi:hypothetical protein